MDNQVNFNLYSKDNDLNLIEDEHQDQPQIQIEITGLKSVSKFIGLEDTPIYYENGKFFKVEDNNIVYTDITWDSISGKIEDNPQILDNIKKIIEEETSGYVINIVNNRLSIHNNDENAHPLIQQKIDNGLLELDSKVDGINANLTQQIEETQQDINDKYNELLRDIDDLTDVVEEDFANVNEKINTIETDIANIETDIETIENIIETVEDNSIVKIDYNSNDIGITVTYGDEEKEDVLFTNLATDSQLQSEITARINADSQLDTKIDTTSTTINQRITEVAEEINETIETNVTALQQEDTALQNQINTHSQQITKEISDRTNADSNLQTQITANTTDISELTQVVQDDYDELKGLIDQEIEDRENSDDDLQDQIDNLKARGHYLSTWDATTGLAGTNPPSNIYVYKSGDYFIVGKVGETNYKPSGTQYTTGVPSTEIETEELAVDDTYIFDGSVWHLQVNHGKTVSFANLAGQPSDNTNLKNTLDSKQDVIEDLEQIRANAQTGANLVSQVETNTTDIGDLKLGKQDASDDTLATVDKTVVGAINELDNKVKDIEKSRNIDATIKGNPTITNGQVSNFSSTDYLILPFAFDPKDRAFEINIAFTTSADVNTAQNLLGGNYCIALLIQNGNLIFRASNNGSSWNVADITTSLSVKPSTNYYVRIYFNKLSYDISYSTNGEDYNQIGYKVTTEVPRHEQVFIGVGNNQFNPFKGIINLNKTYIKLNNSIVWLGMDDIGLLTRADISLSNLDELGEAKFEKGNSAYDTIQNYGDIVTHNTNEFLSSDTTISDLTTEAQLNAINSTITSTKVSNYDSHVANTTIHVTANDKVAWSQKQNTSDNTLTTTDKTIVGAINELNAKPSGGTTVTFVDWRVD